MQNDHLSIWSHRTYKPSTQEWSQQSRTGSTHGQSQLSVATRTTKRLYEEIIPKQKGYLTTLAQSSSGWAERYGIFSQGSCESAVHYRIVRAHGSCCPEMPGRTTSLITSDINQPCPYDSTSNSLGSQLTACWTTTYCLSACSAILAIRLRSRWTDGSGV
jgi:hypothetical protein